MEATGLEPELCVPVIHLDVCPYGDLEIALVTSDIDVTYRVSSHQLCSCSPFFRAMLGPQSSFAEASGLRLHQISSSTSLFRITAEEEHDPTALATVLYVLHGRAEHIPESVTFENLLEIAIICDYYDCAAAMRPWDEIWMSPLRSLSSNPGYEGWLFIAWVFGDQGVFGQMTESFSKNGVMVDGEFRVMVGRKVKRLDCHLPQGIVDAIADQRAKIGQDILTACRDVYLQFESDTAKCRSGGYKTCDYITFGALHKAFRSKNLHPADAELRDHLVPDTIVGIVKSAMDQVKQSVQQIRINNSSHYSCCIPANELVRSLQAIIIGIDPLQLTSFSKKPAASETRSEWARFLHKEGTFSRSIRRTDPEIFCLDVCKYGDMEIILKTNTIHVTYVVSSHQLRAGSPVFRDLLGQDSAFREHASCRHGQTLDSGLEADSNRGNYQLELKKDHDPTALSIVLFILHARVQTLPENVHFDNLVSIVAVCDYYNCLAVLQPWQGKWIDSWRKYSESPGYEDWLFVSWAFREDQIFQTLTKKISESGIIEDNEFVVVVQEEPVKDVKYLSKFIPQAIIDAMIEQRNAAGVKMTQACRDIYEKYNNDTTSRCRTTSYGNVNKMCDRYIFGELHFGFKAARLLADVFSFRSDISINRAVADLNKLSFLLRSNLDSYIGEDIHSSCSVISTELTRIAQNARTDIKPLPLTTFGRKQAEKQVVTWNSVLA